MDQLRPLIACPYHLISGFLNKLPSGCKVPSLPFLVSLFTLSNCQVLSGNLEREKEGTECLFLFTDSHQRCLEHSSEFLLPSFNCWVKDESWLSEERLKSQQSLLKSSPPPFCLPCNCYIALQQFGDLLVSEPRYVLKNY